MHLLPSRRLRPSVEAESEIHSLLGDRDLEPHRNVSAWLLQVKGCNVRHQENKEEMLQGAAMPDSRSRVFVGYTDIETILRIWFLVGIRRSVNTNNNNCL